MSFKIYKRGQGYYTRLYGGIALFAVVAIGCYKLHGQLGVYNSVAIETLIPAGVCVAFSALIFWLTNKPSLCDFLIAAEGEIKKVSWSSRGEIIASTTVVMVVVALLAGMIFAADFVFIGLFREVLAL